MSDLLQAPTNRLPLYLVHFSEIYNSISRIHPASVGIANTIQKILSITDYIAKSAANTRARDKVVYIQETVFKSHVALVDRSRKFIREGTLNFVTSKSAHFHTFYLFNDFLGWMDKGMFTSTFGGIMHIGGLRIAPYIPENSGVKYSFRIGNIVTNVEWWISCDSEKTRERWVKDICAAIRDFYSLSASTSSTTGDNPNNTSANVTLTHILHPEEFEKMIKKKKYNNTRLVKLPPPGIPDDILKQSSTNLLSSIQTAPSISLPHQSNISPPPIPSRSSIARIQSTKNTNLDTNIESRSLGKDLSITQKDKYLQTPINSISTSQQISSITTTDNLPQSIGTWKRLYHDDSKRYYYENTDQQITQWEPPAVYIEYQKKHPNIPYSTLFSPIATTTTSTVYTYDLKQPTSVDITASKGPSHMAGNANLLSAINKESNLQNLKDISSSKNMSQSDTPNDLLSALKKPPALRKVVATQPQPETESFDENLTDALKRSLANYRKFVQDEPKIEDDDDDEWMD